MVVVGAAHGGLAGGVRFRFAASTAVVALCIVVTRDPARAGGFGIPEVGVRRTAMGAVVGRPDDASAIYHNPAGLILSDGWHVYVSCGLSLLDASFELAPWQDSNQILGVQPQRDGYYAPVKPTRAYGVIPMIAVTGEIIPDRLVVGVAGFVGNATGATFASDAVTRYHLIDAYVIAPQAVVAAAYRLTRTLSLGASVGAVNIRIHDEQLVYPIIDGANASPLVGSNSKLVLDGSGWAPTWMVGAFGQPTPRVTWGATLTGRVDATLEGPVAFSYGSSSPMPGQVLDGLQQTQQLLPWAASAGTNVDVTPHLELGGEARYWLYRQYKEQTTDIVGIFFVSKLDSEKDYHDSWEVSGGARVHDLTALPRVDLMAGLQYDQSPAPTATETLSQPSFSHVGLHSGVRYGFGRWRIGASYLRYWYEVPTITNSSTSPPTDIRGHGGNNIFTVSVEAKL
jgi:long-subunit fatty acid transport protein